MIKVGEKIPSATLREKTADGIQPIETGAFFSGKKVVVFCVPGAFTPTCSAKHVPGFVQQADAIRAKGVHEIACIAVNDPFVMGAWAAEQKTEGKVRMLSDGNAEFVKKLGLDMDGSGFGLGTRGRRFAMVVEDGVVRHLAVEEAPSGLDVSSAEAVLKAL